jgi:hypothetical protein
MSSRIRRWLFRGVVMTLCLACVAGWIASALQPLRGVWWNDNDSYDLRLDGRSILVGHVKPSIHDGSSGMRWFFLSPERPVRKPFYGDGVTRFLGFALWSSPLDPRDWTVWVPFWFPTLLCAGLFFLVWRWTRTRHNGRGFPVDIRSEGHT